MRSGIVCFEIESFKLVTIFFCSEKLFIVLYDSFCIRYLCFNYHAKYLTNMYKSIDSHNFVGSENTSATSPTLLPPLRIRETNSELVSTTSKKRIIKICFSKLIEIFSVLFSLISLICYSCNSMRITFFFYIFYSSYEFSEIFICHSNYTSKYVILLFRILDFLFCSKKCQFCENFICVL